MSGGRLLVNLAIWINHLHDLLIGFAINNLLYYVGVDCLPSPQLLIHLDELVRLVVKL